MTLSKKQIGVIFKNWKEGNITTSPEGIKYFYSFANYYSNWDDEIYEVKGIIDSLFQNDYAEAQRCIDYLAEIHSF